MSASETLPLHDATARLHGAQDAQARLQRAQEVLDQARRHSTGSINITALADATASLLKTWEKAEGKSEERRGLASIAHEFIDLARHTSVRHAAYPAEPGRPGALWLEHIIRMIDGMDFTVGRMFAQRAAQYPNKTLFVVPHGQDVTEYSFERVAMMTRQIARGVLALLENDPKVAIFTPNRIEGALFDLACLTNGIFNTLVPANSLTSQLEYILVESGARMLVVSGAEQLQSAFAALENLPSLKWVITLDALPTVGGAKVVSLNNLMERGNAVSDAALEAHAARVRSGEVATTMYTSGTTGSPKGITFTHLNLISKRFARAAALPDINENEVFLCYLPLYHTFGRYLEMLGCVHLAATYVFAESASTETLIRHMRQFKPTAMISVPKKWLDLRGRVTGSDQPPDNPEEISRALRELTGGRLRWGLSAAGRLDPAVFRFFQYHGIDLLSGYGMTEATGGITMTPSGKYVDDSIGKALPAIELGIGDDGELLLRGPYVTNGYTDPEDNATFFREGWFCTGDIVSRDAAGYLKHVDRKKDIYKNASGRTIAPQRVEALFADFPEVLRVFAVGDGREYVTLLIRPNLSYPEVKFGNMSEAELHEYFRGLVFSCNRFLASFERVVNFALIDRDFALEQGELTPKGSFCRSVVEKHFGDVIESMYASPAIERMVGGLRVKIPVAFLQHLGETETGTRAEDDGVVFRGISKKLRIRRDDGAANLIWIGNCCYEVASRDIDLDDWLRLPKMWVGNAELTNMSGDSILLWSLGVEDRPAPGRMVRIGLPEVPIAEWQRRLDVANNTTPSMLTVHAAAVMLSGKSQADALRAVDYLSYTMTAGLVRYQELAESHLQHAANRKNKAVRSRAFAALWEHQPPPSFAATAAMFCESLLDFLDDRACERIARIGLKAESWRHLTSTFRALRRGLTEKDDLEPRMFAMSLMRSLGRIGALNDDFFLPVRQELMAWMLSPVHESIRDAAEQIAEELTTAFRSRLGERQNQAVDPVTGRTYTWGETLQFEDGIDPDELARIADAIQHTDLVREAVYLLHQKRVIDLADLTPAGIWISLSGTRFGRSMYHVGVRLRSNERCDFALYVRGVGTPETLLTDLQLMCVAAGGPDEAPLTPQLGGYWPGYGLATLEYIPRESVEALVKHMHEHPDREVRQRLKDAWKHLSWSALTAAFKFHVRTEDRWVLTGTITRDIAVPLNDFEEDTRVFSVAGWRPFAGTLDMILRLKHAFLDRVRFQYPALSPGMDDEILLAAAIEARGLRAGLDFLRAAIAEGEGINAPAAETVELCRRMRAYVEQVSETGYMPRGLYFAIARYHTWSAQVPGAGVYARAAQLRELQRNYRIEAIARKFPGSRLWLYSGTVLKDAPEEGRRTIEHAIRRLRDGTSIKEVLGRLYSDLREKLPSQDQQYFLTRAAYPHLEPNEKAELISSTEAGPDRAELVTVHSDGTDHELRIRPVGSPRELDTLHRIFYTCGLGTELTPHERFFVAVDQAGYVIGGTAYVRRTPGHVLVDKLAVLPRCRGRGIGRILLQEFLRRQAAEGVTTVSAEFIRASWLAHFGFKSDPRYAGVVLALAGSE